MKLLPIMQYGNRWVAFHDRQRADLGHEPTLNQPATVLTDPHGAISGITTVNGQRQHAAATIEKQLRADGLLDGESQMVVHHVERAGNNLRVFYTAIPAEAWQRLSAWAASQSDHCLLTVPEGALWRTLESGQGVVARIGRHLCFVGRAQGQALHARAIALSDDPAELHAAATTLGRRVADQIQRSGHRLALHWCILDGDHAAWASEQGLTDAFTATSGLTIQYATHRTFTSASGTRHDSVLPELLERSPAAIALNPGMDRLAMRAESLLPWLTAASLIGAAVLVALSFRHGGQQSEYERRLAQTQSQVQSIEQALPDLRRASELPTDLVPALTFLDRTTEIRASGEPVPVLNAIRTASEDDAIHIMRVRSDEASEIVGSVIAEGRLLPHGGNQHLAQFVERLRQSGYQPSPVEVGGSNSHQPPGFFAYQIRPIQLADHGGMP